MQLPIWGGNEVAVLLEACAYHGECRGLHSADGIVSRAGSYRQRAAGVHAHQPVRLRPAVRGGIEAVVVAAVPEVFHPFADGFVRQRGNPQALERLCVAQIVIYPTEDEFSFPTRIRCHDDAVALGENLINGLELFVGGYVCHHTFGRLYLPGDQSERFGNHREVVGGSFRVAICAGQCQRHEVSQRPRDHIPVADTIAVLFFCSPDYAGYIHSYTRFFCYDCFHVRIKIKPFPVTGTGKQETAV